MTRRGRPRGSKNRKKRLTGSTYDRALVAFTNLPYEVLDSILKLQEDSGIEMTVVMEDIVAEGHTCCREDLYAEIIKRRANRGKVVREDGEPIGTVITRKTYLYPAKDPEEQNEPEREQRNTEETEATGTSGLQRGVGLVDDPERQYAPAEDQGSPGRSDIIAMRPRLEGEDTEGAVSTEEEMG